MLDIMFATFSGELLFYTPNGTAFKDRTFEVKVHTNMMLIFTIMPVKTCFVHLSQSKEQISMHTPVQRNVELYLLHPNTVFSHLWL